MQVKLQNGEIDLCIGEASPLVALTHVSSDRCAYRGDCQWKNLVQARREIHR